MATIRLLNDGLACDVFTGIGRASDGNRMITAMQMPVGDCFQINDE